MNEEQSIYEYLGGDPIIKSICARFYEVMDQLPQAKEIRDMHPEDLSSSEEKLFLFLCGWFGGPQRYIQKYGHPRLRARHLPFAIDESASKAWMTCMRIALAEYIPNKDVRAQIEQIFARMADHMRNQGDL